jgi:hypothetical protein
MNIVKFPAVKKNYFYLFYGELFVNKASILFYNDQCFRAKSHPSIRTYIYLSLFNEAIE